MNTITDRSEMFLDRVKWVSPDLNIKQPDKAFVLRLLLMDYKYATNLAFSYVLSSNIIKSYSKLMNGEINCHEFMTEILEIIESFLWNQITLVIDEKKSDLYWGRN